MTYSIVEDLVERRDGDLSRDTIEPLPGMWTRKESKYESKLSICGFMGVASASSAPNSELDRTDGRCWRRSILLNGRLFAER